MALSDQVKKAIATYIWDSRANVAAFATATTAIEYHDGGVYDLIVRKTPILGVTTIFDMQASATIAATSYQYYTAQGAIFYDDGDMWGDEDDRRRFKITYTYGFTAIPEDIQLAIDTWVNYLTANNSGAISSYSTGDDSETYANVQDMPLTVRNLISKYRRMVF